MSRFTKTFLDLGAQPAPSHLCDFIGWDALSQGQPATEATHARDCGKPMSARDMARFEALRGGTCKTVDGVEYFREW